MGHSSLGASSAHRWMACPGSINRSEGLPGNSSDAAKEGTAAHALGEKCLIKQVDADTYLGDTFEGFEADEDMCEAVQVYVDWAKGLPPHLLIEEKFDLDWLFPGMYGTSDVSVYNPELKRITVGDYKHGAGLPVDIWGNVQLKYYGLGAAMKCKESVEEVEIVIIQPRCPHPDGPVRSQIIPIMDMIDWSTELRDAAIATTKDDAPLVAGDHCRWCKALGVCEEVKRQSLNASIREFSDDMAYNIHDLADSLKKVKLVEMWLKGVKSFADRISSEGVDIPEHKLVAKKSNRMWNGFLCKRELIEKFPFLENKDIETAPEPKLHSPAVIEKLIKSEYPAKKAVDKEARNIQLEKLSGLNHKPDNGTTLVHESDKRTEVANTAYADFKDIVDD